MASTPATLIRCSPSPPPHLLPFNSRISSSKAKLSQFHLLSLPPIIKLHLHNHTKHPITKTNFILKATENGSQKTENDSENPTTTTTDQQQQSSEEQLSELGSEIKKAMKEKEEDSGGFLNGVVDEIGKIEWPQFVKVIATTGVGLGVIAGSSVVLLTVNAVLAELSDRVFAGKGVQDVFGG